MRVLFGEQWAYAWPVLGLLAISKGILTPCSTFIPYLKGIGRGGILFWWALLRAAVTTAAVAAGALRGSLVEAMIALCIVNAVVLAGYSWIVFRADDKPFLRGFLQASRPMFTSIVMAVAVRALLDSYGYLIPNPALQMVAGILAGGMIYAVLILLTERPLLRTLMALTRKSTPPATAVAAIAE